MTTRIINKAGTLRGELTVPADKSVSHRSIMLGALASGTSVVRNFLRAEDPISTMNAFRMLGIDIQDSGSEVTIHGKGIRGMSEPMNVIDCGNSGTTMRLMSGVLAGQPFFSVLTGDDSLRQRPMARVIEPLRTMGAVISGRGGDKYAPFALRGTALKPTSFALPIASAQVKSCILLAGLGIDGTTTVTEPEKTRDHTELMLRAMGADLTVDGLHVALTGGRELQPFEMTVPSDFSSAAFFIAAALITPNAEVTIKSVGVNPTRTGMLDILALMGVAITLENARIVSGEPIADIVCTTADGLKAVTLGKREVARAIDEFPILCILASQADGTTIIRGAKELRVKESDRIAAMAEGLKRMGVQVEEFEDGIAITGKAALKGAEIESYHDHRIAMAFAVAGLIADGETAIRHASCADISFPGFYELLGGLTR